MSHENNKYEWVKNEKGRGHLRSVLGKDPYELVRGGLATLVQQTRSKVFRTRCDLQQHTRSQHGGGLH